MSTVAELLATWLGPHLFGWLATTGRSFSVSAGTDNLANELVLRRQSTTKFPLTYVYMQLEYDLYRCGGHMSLNWRPRELNVAAGELTNSRFESFDLAKRVELHASDMPCELLRELASFHDEMLEWRKGGEGGPFHASLRGRSLLQRRSGDASLVLKGEGHLPNGRWLSARWKAHFGHSKSRTAFVRVFCDLYERYWILFYMKF